MVRSAANPSLQREAIQPSHEFSSPGVQRTKPRAPAAGGQTLVNLGCGGVYHPAWVNLDFAPRGPGVRSADIRRRLPFADRSVDAVYHSHVLEHLDRDDAARLLAENCRVLKRGGVLRVAVPDLEALCRSYLDALDGIERGEPGAGALYDWSLLDLLDQMVRRKSGGKMPQFLASIDMTEHPRIAERMTVELREHVTGAQPRRPGGLLRRLARDGWRGVPRRAARGVNRLRQSAAYVLVSALAGRDVAAAFQEGRFRATGEVHRWMYDRYSLGRSLRAAGFADIAFMEPFESHIPGFADYELDTVGLRVRRPGSLFVEARKP